MDATDLYIKFYSKTGMTIYQPCEHVQIKINRGPAPIYTINQNKDIFYRRKRMIAGSLIAKTPFLEGQEGQLEIIQKNNKYLLEDVKFWSQQGTTSTFTAKDLVYIQGKDPPIDEVCAAQPMTGPAKIDDFMDIKYDIVKVIQEECMKTIGDKPVECECGAEKCNLSTHSDWCPKHQ